ncbi:MAG: ABC transporter ATP-binding protein, partial [Oscillospiraceae bacterium]|nr:ABC transporter ATP-binding protein [Oscillospiraceae bacterium]
MIGMIRRILGVSGKYRGRIYGAFALSFLKGMIQKMPVILVYFTVVTFLDGTVTRSACLYIAIALVASVSLQAVFQYFA